MRSALLLGTMLVTGCAYSGRKIDRAKLEQIEIGVTTADEVLELLGPPQQRVDDSTGVSVYVYVFASATARPATFIPIVGAVAGGIDSRSEFVEVFCENGVVVNVATGEHNSDARLGSPPSSTPKPKRKNAFSKM